MSEKATEWLNGLGLGQYADAFKKNAIDWELLPDIDQDALKDIGVEATGHRLRILKAIAALQTEQSTALSPAKNQSTNESSARPSADEDINAWSRTPGERKPVTMLFSDIVGSTSLTEKLDAEDGLSETNKNAIIDLSVEYQVLSKYTAFLAIDPKPENGDNGVDKSWGSTAIMDINTLQKGLTVRAFGGQLHLDFPANMGSIVNRNGDSCDTNNIRFEINNLLNFFFCTF